MKTRIFGILKYLGSKLLSATAIVLIIGLALKIFPVSLFVTSGQVIPQSSQTTTPIPLIPPTPLAYADALHTYELVATTAIQSSERTLNFMVAVFAAIIGLAALAAGAASYIYKASKDAEERAKSAEISASSAKNSAENANQQVTALSKNYIELSNRYANTLRDYIQMRSQTLSLDAAIQAREKGEISHERFIEAQQWNSWLKWIDLKQETGWQELKIHQAHEMGLVPTLRVTIEMELARFSQGRSDSNMSQAEREYKQRLIDLLDFKIQKGI